jgi:hypothetical protein
MENTVRSLELTQPNFNKVRRSATLVVRAMGGAADFVWQSIFESNLRIHTEPGVSKEIRNEGVDKVQRDFGRRLI